MATIVMPPQKTNMQGFSEAISQLLPMLLQQRMAKEGQTFTASENQKTRDAAVASQTALFNQQNTLADKDSVAALNLAKVKHGYDLYNTMYDKSWEAYDLAGKVAMSFGKPEAIADWISMGSGLNAAALGETKGGVPATSITGTDTSKITAPVTMADALGGVTNSVDVNKKANLYALFAARSTVTDIMKSPTYNAAYKSLVNQQYNDMAIGKVPVGTPFPVAKAEDFAMTSEEIAAKKLPAEIKLLEGQTTELGQRGKLYQAQTSTEYKQGRLYDAQAAHAGDKMGGMTMKDTYELQMQMNKYNEDLGTSASGWVNQLIGGNPKAGEKSYTGFVNSTTGKITDSKAAAAIRQRYLTYRDTLAPNLKTLLDASMIQKGIFSGGGTIATPNGATPILKSQVASKGSDMKVSEWFDKLYGSLKK